MTAYETIIKRTPQTLAATATPASNRLWTKVEAAEFFGVSLRTFANMLSKGTVPKGVLLHDKVVRWRPDECMTALQAMPRAELAEPDALVTARQVRRARIEAMKAGVGASPDAVDAAVKQTIVRAKAPGWMASK